MDDTDDAALHSLVGRPFGPMHGIVRCDLTPVEDLLDFAPTAFSLLDDMDSTHSMKSLTLLLVATSVYNMDDDLICGLKRLDELLLNDTLGFTCVLVTEDTPMTLTHFMDSHPSQTSWK
eukprot:GHVH01008123.1.p1 GENE.GHVH01008123.1~~GHVH01008123.1.p1  ORF type:complete len:119 (+),score=13.45 GHVH01008123.1:79-435(+)